MEIVGRIRRSYRPMVCQFCGEETLSGGDSSFCSNCESQIWTDRKTLEANGRQLMEGLDAIRASLAGEDFDSAGAAYDAIIAGNKDPRLLYAKGIMLIRQSNSEVGKIAYNREGFMDENIAHRDRGARLASEAKRLIAKSLYASRAESAASPSPGLWYNILLCELRMNNPRGALGALDRLKASKAQALADYSELLVAQESGDYKGGLGLASRIVESGNPPVNALYYLSFNLFKLGRAAEAGALLKAIEGLGPRRSELLAGAIDGALSV